MDRAAHRRVSLGAFVVLTSAMAASATGGCSGGNTNSGPTEQGVALCSDGVDNDGDGRLDCIDDGCVDLAICATSDGGVGAENTMANCTDGVDNDGNGLTDCADPGCRVLVICSKSDAGGDAISDGGDSGPSTCNCDDGLSCTTDACDASGVCLHGLRAATCLIDQQCYADGAKNGTQCQVCDAAKNKSGWTAIVGGCTIGGYCYRPGDRSADGCSVCEPSRSSTDWTPMAVPTCRVGGRCYLNGQRDTTGCQICDVATSTTALSPSSQACSIGGMCFEQGAAHPSASCATVSCNASVSSTAWTIGGDECLISNVCYAAGAKSANGCQQCIPSQSKTSWTSASSACQISGGCYENLEKHPSPTCLTVRCDGSKSTSAWTIDGNECLIAGVCRQPGDKTANGCQECNPALSKTAWSTADAACNIGGSCYASKDAHPSATCKTVTCEPTASNDSWTIAGNECLISGVCYAAGAKAPGNCQECNPALSKTAWSPLATSCVIGGACYLNGATHPSSACAPYGVVCDSTKSGSGWTINGTGCLINNVCYAPGANDATGCAKCDPAVSKTSWTPNANTCVIGGACYPNGATHPSMLCSSYGVSCDTTKSATNWTVAGSGCAIGSACYASGALDPTGCFRCDPAASKTSWTAQSTCTRIVMAALNEGHLGGLGGITGANTLCAAQAAAAGYGGTWRAFLSSSTQNVRDLVTGTKATTIPVVNTKGENLYASWSAIWTQSTWNSASTYLWSFSGKFVDEGQATPDWYDADGWTGSLATGTVAATTCSDWTSSASTMTGANGEWDFQQLLKTENDACSNYLAVACVSIP